MVRNIYDITKFSVLDFPNHTSCIIWFSGCNMRCVYCYNPSIVLNKGLITEEEAFSFLEKRKGLLEGVVMSGGECTIHKNFEAFVGRIKSMGFKVKVDTNGSRPKVINSLITKRLVDYVALDFKSLPSSFKELTKSSLFSSFEKTLEILCESNIDFEVRTTVHSDLISKDDLVKMRTYLTNKGYNRTYFIQHFREGTETLSELPSHNQDNYDSIEIKQKKEIVFR